MSVFLSGGTGFLGGYVVSELLQGSSEKIHVLVREKDKRACEEKLWRALQLHISAEQFFAYLPRLHFVYGDLTQDNLGMSRKDHDELLGRVDSVLHIAASLNRRSEKVCMNVNLRGTLSMIKLGLELEQRRRLRRFSYVSTVAVAGQRQSELVSEDASIDWSRSDYDPYARTKKFAEHMVRQMLPSEKVLIMRPSIVMGDSRFAQTSQFDMVRAFAALMEFPALPMNPKGRLDIVNADFVGAAIARLHQKQKLSYDCYHLSSGRDALSAGEIAKSVCQSLDRRVPRFTPAFEHAFSRTVDAGLLLPKESTLYRVAVLLKVFWPYITFDTVFDSARVEQELGLKAVPFNAYAAELYRFAKESNFSFPFSPLPQKAAKAA
ncbi:MAG: SDR family oxidoreductase [Myxococcales bacterium]|nr:MAG: SDR family oxidoreductase [Myxococcales bacterium]